ncbi:MAG: aspartate--tRNA(Asn) ligase, partial [Candidatus Thermoplasmatota archaeon]
EVHTPKTIISATEGGANLFPLQYFEKQAFLAQSPQLYKQILMATGFDKVYEIAPCFRAEEHNTPRHLNEFIGIDIEQAFANEEDVMQTLERMIQRIINRINEMNSKELELLGVKLPSAKLPFNRVKYDDCVEILKSKNIEAKYGEDFSTEALRVLGEEFKDFYFITKWPTQAKPFYIQPFEDEKEFCRAFDLMYWDKEITSGGQRVHNPILLRQRLEEQGLNPENFKYYLEAFEYGMPQHAGWGLGVERTLMILTGIENIRECTLFPRDRTRLVP